jgi:tetratricopeptide (TPR) repeat protein
MKKDDKTPKEYLAEITRNLGFFERDIGLFSLSEKHLQKAFKLFTSVGNSEGAARTLIDLGLVQKDKTDLTHARLSLERALSQVLDIQDKGHALLGMGLVSEKLNNFQEAHNYYLKAVNMYKKAKDYENEAVALQNLGQLYDNQGKFEDALDYYKKSFKINYKNDVKLGMVENLTSIASICQLIDVEQAKKIHEQILGLQKEIEDLRGQIWTLCDLGLIAANLGDFAEAKRRFNESLTISKEMGDPQEVFEVHISIGNMYFNNGQTLNSAKEFVEAIQSIESIRSRLLLEKEALYYFNEQRIQAYDKLVILYGQYLNDTQQALFWLERSKAQELLRRLRLTSILNTYQIPKSLISKEKWLLAAISRTMTSIASPLLSSDSSTVSVTLQRFEKLECQLDKLWEKIKVLDPEYVALRRGEFIPFEEIRKLLC